MHEDLQKRKRMIIKLRFLSGLLSNGVTGGILVKKLETRGIHVDRKQLQQLIKIARQYKRNHPQWRFVEVHSADGEYVEISL